LLLAGSAQGFAFITEICYVKGRRKRDIMSSPKEVKIYKNWCKKCGICIAFCPKKALEADEDGYPSLKDNKTCTGCGLCELLCPDFAIVVDHDENRVASRE